LIAFWRHMQVSNLAAAEFCTTLDALGLAQCRVARLFAVGPRSVRRWRDGTRRIPRGVDIVLRLLAAGEITVAQVEEIAFSTQTNGSAKGEPPAPLRAEPAPEQSTLACAQAATLAGPGPTTAEKLCALAPGTCRWPGGDPRHRDFHFCGASVVAGPYCESHRAMAYMAPRTGSGPRVGFVAYGRHGRPSIPGAFSATGASRPPKILLDRAGGLPGGAPPPA